MQFDIVQIVLIGIGLVIAGSIFFKKDDKKDDKENEPVTPVIPLDIHDDETDHDFICLIHKWHCLKKCAHDQGLHEVCKILDEQVFPKLNQSHDHKEEEVIVP